MEIKETLDGYNLSYNMIICLYLSGQIRENNESTISETQETRK